MNDLYLGENMDINEAWTLYQTMLLKCITGNNWNGFLKFDPYKD